MEGINGLTHLSPSIFDAGINGRFPEADNNAMDMRNNLPQAFLYLVQWLYKAVNT